MAGKEGAVREFSHNRVNKVSLILSQYERLELQEIEYRKHWIKRRRSQILRLPLHERNLLYECSRAKYLQCPRR